MQGIFTYILYRFLKLISFNAHALDDSFEWTSRIKSGECRDDTNFEYT
jgi:hypothetical protein